MYFMRGALLREDMFDLTPMEREIYSEFIKERLEVELNKKHSNPVY